MAITYSYTSGAATNLDRLRFLLGDNRGVPATYATIAAFIDSTTGAKAAFTDEELNDLLAAAMCNSDIISAARVALQSKINREAMIAGVAGTTDTTDRPAAMVNALRNLATLAYPLSAGLPGTEVTTNVALDDADLTDMGDEK